MKLRITFKSPDAVDSAKLEAEKRISLLEPEDGILPAYQRQIEEGRLNRVLRTWIKWGEFVTIELDTETGTAVVVPCN